MVFSEIWPDISDNDIQLECFRSDRCDRLGGGVIIYIHDTYLCCRRTDFEIQELEAVWMEVTVGAKKAGFTDHKTVVLIISESLDRAHNTNINDTIIVGNFTYSMLFNENNRVKDLMQLYGLKQLIKEATHYTEYSASLIDLIMVRNK